MADEPIFALARDIAERRSGMPAYLVDDETWAAALDEAHATYVPPEPPSLIQEAIRKAGGRNPTGDEIAESIGFLNRMSAAIRAVPASPTDEDKRTPR